MMPETSAAGKPSGASRAEIVAGVNSLRPIDIAIAIAMVVAYAGYFATSTEWVENVLLIVATVMLTWVIFESRFFRRSSD